MIVSIYLKVKRIHDFVAEKSIFTQKQVREVLFEVQQNLGKHFIPSQTTKLNKSQSLSFLSTKTVPWNYGVGGTPKVGGTKVTTKKLYHELKEKERKHSMSLIDIHELSKLLTTRSSVSNSYLDM